MKKNRLAIGQTKMRQILRLADPLIRHTLQNKVKETISKALAAKTPKERFDAVDNGLFWLQTYLRNEVATKLFRRATDEQCDIWGSSIFYVVSREIEYQLEKAGKLMDGLDDDLRLLLAPTQKQIERIKVSNFESPLFMHSEDNVHLKNLPIVQEIQEIKDALRDIRTQIHDELHEVMSLNDSRELLTVKERVRLMANRRIDGFRLMIQSRVDGIEREEMNQIITFLRREIHDYIEKVIVDFGELTDHVMIPLENHPEGHEFAESMTFYEQSGHDPIVMGRRKTDKGGMDPIDERNIQRLIKGEEPYRVPQDFNPSPTPALEEEQLSQPTQLSQESIMKINAPITSLFTNSEFLTRWSALVAEIEKTIAVIKAKAEDKDEFVNVLKTDFIKNEVLMSRVYAIIGEVSGETFDAVEVTELAAKLMDRQVLAIEPLAQIHGVDIADLVSTAHQHEADKVIEKARHSWFTKTVLFSLLFIVAGLFAGVLGAGLFALFFYTQRFAVPFLQRFFSEGVARNVYFGSVLAAGTGTLWVTGLLNKITKWTFDATNGMARLFRVNGQFERSVATTAA